MGRLIDADDYLAKERPRGITDDIWEESHVYKSITNAPPVEAIPIPKGVTNGEMLLALFPDTKCFQNNGIINTDIDGGTLFNEDWWGAPYKRGNRQWE